jgi:hypothetical protein
MPQIRVAAVSRVNIRLGYDRLVCPKRSSPWQSIGGDSRMRPLSNSAECPDVMDPERGSVSSGAVVALCRTVAGRVPACKCRAERVQLRGRLVPLSGYQVRSGEVQRSSAEPGLSGAIRGLRGNQGLTGASRFRGLLLSLTAQLRAAALGVLRCIVYYLRNRSCRHTAAYGSLSLSVCVATLPYSGSPHRHSQGLQCFLSRSPTLSGSFQKNLRLSLIL